MPKKSQNANLVAARKNKNDEFYTQLTDIEKELNHYKHHFNGKVVYCNCDDPRVSNFFHYFSYGFEHLGLKKLITTCYKSQNPDIFSLHDSEKAIYLEYNGDKNDNRVPIPEEIGIYHLESDGDFRSEECIALLKQVDIVVTNPPFSLFKEYVAQLIQYDKKFVIIGSLNAVTYKEIFPLIRDNKLWLGTETGSAKWFGVPDHYDISGRAGAKTENGKKYFSMGSTIWCTNLDINKRHEDLLLYKTYAGNESEYLKYDNYDAINVDKTNNIPQDYAGVMGVPISFLNKHNPDQFEIVGLIAGNIKGLAGIVSSTGKDGPYINGKLKYGRIIIKNKRV